MTPLSFAKVAVRWAASAQFCLALPPELRYLPSALQALFDHQPIESVSAVVLAPVIAVMSILVPLVLWFGAGRIARYLVPAGSDLTPAADYEEWQQMGLTCVGVFMLLRVVMIVPNIVSNLMAGFGAALDMFTTIELAFYLIAGLLLVFGWRAPVRVLTWPFRRV